LREAQIQSAVIEHWRIRGRPGSLVAAIPNQKAFGQAGLTPGLYDLVVIGPLGAGFLELKTEKGKLSDHQRTFGETCTTWGVPNAVAYGLDEAIGILSQWQIFRSPRQS
jgi:hypothetical protein